MGTLKCKELTKVYQDHHYALDKVALTLETNGIFALIRRNGAGNTLIRILTKYASEIIHSQTRHLDIPLNIYSS